MANKNHAGTQYMRHLSKEDRLISKIDKRTDNGKDRENVDHVWQKHTINTNGERCWSF